MTYASWEPVYIGTYSFEIYAQLENPYNSVNIRSAPFTLTVTDPCVTSISQNLVDMTIHIDNDPTDTQNFVEYTDEAQVKYGSIANAFCGADRSY